MILCSLISINRYSYPISAYLHKRKGHKEPKDADASNVPHSTMLQDVAVFLSLFLVWEIKERNTNVWRNIANHKKSNFEM